MLHRCLHGANLRSLAGVASFPPFAPAANGRCHSSVGTRVRAMATQDGSPKKKVLAVLPRGGEAASNSAYLCCVENGLNLREWLEGQGHTYITTDSKEGSDSELEKHLADSNIIITTPFHPAYLTPERLNKAGKLELVLTAGIGSDHVNLDEAMKKGITVAEVTGSNVESVAEDVVMRILILMRNFIPAYKQIIEDTWDVAAVANKARDLKAKTIGTVGGGRIGWETMRRLKNFDCNLMYFDRGERPLFADIGCRYEENLDKLLAECDVVTINVPLTNSTRGMFNSELIGKMKKGAYLVNTARGAICNTDAVVDALKSGHLAGYSGDVWAEQPPAKNHPWRHMPNHALTCHLSGTTLDAQVRYGAGTREMLEQWLKHEPFKKENYIVREGELASQYK